ncbi:hypothetical protein A7A08_00548 [Methyloligella halotolerans]|uniref:Uncharacterized protein n=1 Tax=Methyloligella halotolerans TaxID=1177755 RepID=A0A1E2S2H6_9HYPH|nr:hypothetical protein A7A08_00548 [Methyloligella halotolerans]
MNLYRLGCWRPNDALESEPRVALVAAASASDAVEVCHKSLGLEVYAKIEVLDAMESNDDSGAVPSGPARVIGFEGDRAGTWK